MTATTLPVPSTRRTADAKALWKAGAVSGLAASAATATLAATAHEAFDVSLRVGGQAIPVIAFAQVTFVTALIGTVIAVVMSHRAARPARTFTITTIALTLVSLVPDALADAGSATRFTLALTHVVAAAIVISELASRLSD